ncbi:hypothetical protein ABTZ78_17130 [Streptomyces bauhiniae]|uniref:hypothetical protein n=1 Tax=Streptomyces bauhiniae TaxID=2340725 RepID=UPI00332FEDEE
MTGRLEVLGDDGEPEEHPAPPPEPALLQLYIEQGRAVRNAYITVGRAYSEAARPVMETLARGIEAYGRALRAAGVIDRNSQ